jgi:hypothetical protein
MAPSPFTALVHHQYFTLAELLEKLLFLFSSPPLLATVSEYQYTLISLTILFISLPTSRCASVRLAFSLISRRTFGL